MCGKGFENFYDILYLEIIIIDDCSTDSSLSIARDIAKKDPKITVIQHDKNQGKGAALQTGFNQAVGDFIAIQDADLEYNPNDILRLLEPLASNEADVVFGSRFCLMALIEFCISGTLWGIVFLL